MKQIGRKRDPSTRWPGGQGCTTAWGPLARTASGPDAAPNA
jgi:hypothetical protein